MAWSAGFPFTESAIRASAPAHSGVYALYNAQRWVYVGESEDIRTRLLQHFAESGTCIKQQGELHFCWELVPGAERIQWQDKLIFQLRPVCNQRSG